MTMGGMTSSEITLVSKTAKLINDEVRANSEDTGIANTDVILVEQVQTAGADEGQKVLNVTFVTDVYSDLDQLQKQEVIGIILNTIEESDMSQISRSKMYSFISNSDETTSNLVRQLSNDVRADFVSAYSTFKPFSGTLGWILGLLTLTIFLMLGITVVLDMAYIVVPLFQNILSSENENVKPRYVSNEAWNSVKQAEASTTGGRIKEPMSMYFGLKSKQFLAIGICLLYLASGQIYNLIANIMDSFRGILG